jgi:hypothetical protein
MNFSTEFVNTGRNWRVGSVHTDRGDGENFSSSVLVLLETIQQEQSGKALRRWMELSQ